MTSITLIRDGRAAQRPRVDMAAGEHARFRVPLPVAAVFGWICAALAAYAVELGAHGRFAGLPRAAVALVKIALILGAGALYARVVRGAPSDLLLSTGLAWLVFSIAADVVTGIRSNGYQLLGDPLTPLRLRDVTVLAWLGAPALFTWRGVRDNRRADLPPYR
jgi:hypothetical protein